MIFFVIKSYQGRRGSGTEISSSDDKVANFKLLIGNASLEFCDVCVPERNLSAWFEP